jgi:hypothetical protein
MHGNWRIYKRWGGATHDDLRGLKATGNKKQECESMDNFIGWLAQGATSLTEGATSLWYEMEQLQELWLVN